MDNDQFKTFMESFTSILSRAMQNQPAAGNSEVGNGNVPIILNFEHFNKSTEKFSQYTERFENFISMKGLSTTTDATMVKKLFLNNVGSEIYEILSAISAPKSINELSYQEIIDLLTKYLSPAPNVLIEQHRFLCRLQNDNESIGEYVAALRRFLSTCDFNCTSCHSSIADQFLRAQFIRGLRNSSIREKLLSDKAITFQDAVDKALALQSSFVDSQEIKRAISVNHTDVHKLSKSHASRTSTFRSPSFHKSSASISRSQSNSSHHSSKSSARNRSNSPHSRSRSKYKSRIDYNRLGIADLCFRCGRNDHKYQECKVNRSSVNCNSCGKLGHVSKVCITTLLSSNNKVHIVDLYSTVDSDSIANFDSCMDLSYITSPESIELPLHNLIDSDKYYCTVLIENKPVKFEVDSGCGFTLLPISICNQIGIHDLSPTFIRFRTYDSGIVKPLGMKKVAVTYNNVTSKETLYIVPSHFTAILGRSWIRHLNLVLNELDQKVCNLSPENSKNEHISESQLVEMFPSIFQQTVGKIPTVKGCLELRAGAKPRFRKARDPPYAIRDLIDKELDVLEKEDIITSIENSDWGSPLVPIIKDNGKIRLCVDYKGTVNPQIVDVHHPIPKIDELLTELRQSRYYCKIDLFKAYLHLDMDEDSRKIQTISTHKGTYTFNRLSFGIKPGPGLWNKHLQSLLFGLKGVTVYFDDILVHGPTLAECQQNLLALFKRLQELNLHVNRSKCIFFVTKISYVGYIIEGRKIWKDPSKVRAIMEAAPPTDVTGVKQLLGLITYYSRFIPNASEITFPIRNLLRKNVRFYWSPECDTAFKTLKSILASEKVLIAFDPDLPLSVATDASPHGISAILSHTIDDVERPIMCVSRSLTQAEKNYSQIDREALAIVFALDRFFMYVYGRKFTLITDNKALTHIFHQHAALPPMTAARLLRYAAYLANFNYEIKHRPASDHANVDYFSRFSIPDVDEIGIQELLCHEVTSNQEQTLYQISSPVVTSEIIEAETMKDPVLADIISKLRQDSSDKNALEFTLKDNILFKGNRVYIPASLRSIILSELHSTHSGMTKMKQLARRYCYWPSIDSEIDRLVRSCNSCALTQKTPQKAPLHQWEVPPQNFDRVHIDYAGPVNGISFLILVDAKSKWPEIKVVSKAPTSESTAELLEDIFSNHGYPKMLVSDNAKIFSSEFFSNYCKARGIFQCFSAPNHPATNGLAERYVQILKSKLLKMSEEPGDIRTKVQKILFQFRATPLADNLSPAELYLNRKMRLRLDAIFPFKPSKNVNVTLGKIRVFSVGQKVLARAYKDKTHKWQQGIVQKKLGRLHYLIKLDNNYVLKRHINQLRASFQESNAPAEIEENVPESNVSLPTNVNLRKQVTFAQQPTVFEYALYQSPQGTSRSSPVTIPPQYEPHQSSQDSLKSPQSPPVSVAKIPVITLSPDQPSTSSLPKASVVPCVSSSVGIMPKTSSSSSQAAPKRPSLGRGRGNLPSSVSSHPSSNVSGNSSTSRERRPPLRLKDYVPK